MRAVISDMSWHPWRHLAQHYPHITVSTRHVLPDGVMGLRRGDQMWICATCGQAQRRATLAHEIAHLERGDRGHSAVEERIVSIIAARRLIPFDRLVDGLRWAHNVAELADELWVDEPTVLCRLDSLDPVEVAELHAALGDDWRVA